MKQIKIMEDDDDRELEAAGQSILTNMVEQEVGRLSIVYLHDRKKLMIFQMPSSTFRSQSVRLDILTMKKRWSKWAIG